MTPKLQLVLERVENILGKGHFSFYPYCFLKLSFQELFKAGIIWLKNGNLHCRISSILSKIRGSLLFVVFRESEQCRSKIRLNVLCSLIFIYTGRFGSYVRESANACNTDKYTTPLPGKMLTLKLKCQL